MSCAMTRGWDITFFYAADLCFGECETHFEIESSEFCKWTEENK